MNNEPNEPPVTDTKSQKITDEELEKKRQELNDKIKLNYDEFKRKKMVEIPCFRSTFLTSIPSSLFIGLLSYLVTSKARVASNLTMGSFLTISSAYFITCRMEFNKQVEKNKELGEIMNMIIKYRGTDLEEQFQKRYQEKIQELDTKSKFL